MKRLLPILFTILLGSQQMTAQVSGKFETFRDKVLPEYSMYFTQAGLTESGQLILSALDNYTGLPPDEKKAIMVNIARAWRDSLVLVKYGSKREVWGKSVESGSVSLLDVYDLNSLPLAKPVKTDNRSHPWFFYFGGQFGGDSQNNINLALNLRIGFFLLKNRWDFATTFSGGLTGNTKAVDGGTGWVNTGLMTRVHFPIKKLGISPNVGGEVTVSVYGDTPASINPALVLGISWYVVFGSLDLGISIGNIVSGSGGYTMSPQIKRNK